MAKKIICVSEYDRHIAIASGINSDTLIVIRNAVHDIILDNSKRRDNNSHECIVTMVARFDYQKDHRSLLEAVKKTPGVYLRLVGDGPLLDEIQQYSLHLGINKRVEFLGYQNKIAEILSQSDVFALISNYEGFPITTLEAMRAGLPVIVSNVGGCSEAVDDGITGYLVPRKDVDLIANRLQLLQSNHILRTKMGINARQYFLKSFTFEKMYNETIKVYEEILYK
jgi:glycosyltransferase involved in cell wall biosynthesis